MFVILPILGCFGSILGSEGDSKGPKIVYSSPKKGPLFEEVNSAAVIKGDPISYFFLLFFYISNTS